MNLVDRLRASRLAAKLRRADELDPEELHEVEARLLEMETGALPLVFDCLSHATAKPVALGLLEKLLDEGSLPLYLECLTSSNPAVVSGVREVLVRSKRIPLQFLFDALLDPRMPTKTVEAILTEHSDRIRPSDLGRLIDSEDREARAAVFRLLDKFADETYVPLLIDHIAHDSWWVRLQVVRLLSRFPDPKGAGAVAKRLVDENREVRREAIETLTRLNAKRAAPAIVRCLKDPDLKVQTAAIDSLAKLGGASTVPYLLEVLKDESEYIRRAAVEVLNAVATPDAVQDLVRSLRDEDWWVRVRAADALGTLGGDVVVDAVVTLLDDEDEFIRRYAVEILITVPSEKAVDPLVRVLDDKDWWVRERAIDALGEIGDERAYEPLVHLLTDEIKVAAIAATALGKLGDPRAKDPLKRLAEDGNGEARRAARAALAELRRVERGDKAKIVQKGKKKTTLAVEKQAKDSGQGKVADEAPRVGKAQPSPGMSGPINFHTLPESTVVLDRYRIVRKVGTGGFGTVYLVEDSAVGERVILKILNPQMSADETALRRFVRELKVTRRIAHPNVIRLYDFLDLGGVHAVSMEYFPGSDLGKVLQQSRKIPLERALHIVSQLCAGLGAAHAESVIHRDVKPGNVLVDDKDNVKIVDFGLAVAGHQAGSRLTQSGLLIGTPEYMAPEQISGESVDHRSDLYAVGVLLYEMLSGKLPYTAETPVKILFKHLEGGAPPLQEIAPEVPEPVAALVNAAMARDPADRPADAATLGRLVDEARRNVA
jgi:serine/threonine-protein kinase